MRGTWAVMLDLLREAARRKWFLALFLFTTLALLTLGLFLEMDVVDGAVAATRLFGKLVSNSMQPATSVVRPIIAAATGLIFYGGLLFGGIACADFAPALPAPGRIEFLLSLPLRRWQLFLGTFLGVMVMAAAGALYGATGLVLLLGIKTQVWSGYPLVAALLAILGFASMYAVMMLSSLFVRSAVVSAGCGAVVFILGIVASHRTSLANLFSEGLGRSLFSAVTAFVPRLSSMGEFAISIAAGERVDPVPFLVTCLTVVVWTASMLLFALHRFERQDY